jgi:hypothetical protein
MYQLRFAKYLKEKVGERDDDIHIVAYARSGTTWTQMILYQLTTDGSTDFGHIYDVSPWLEDLFKRNLEFPQLPSPRLLKTHEFYHDLPRTRKGRFIFVLRDGKDVAASMFHQIRAYYNPQLTFDEIFQNIFAKPEGNWFAFVQEWLVNPYGRRILYLRYENMKADLEGVIRRIMDFCELKVDEKEFPRILERSSFAYMKQHQQKFGDQPGREPWARPGKVYDDFIRKGEVGGGRQYFSAEQAAYFEKRLETEVMPFIKTVF